MLCDHCKTARRRSETFIVRQVETGQVKQVGRQCLGDFLGVSPEQFLARWGLWQAVARFGDDEDWQGNGMRTVDTWKLSTVLAVTAAVVRREGWLSKKAVRENGHGTPTSTLVMNWLVGTDPDTRRWVERTPVEACDREAAEQAAAYWAASTDASDYAENARLLVTGGLVIPRAFGLAVSLLPVAQTGLQRIRERELERKNERPSGHVGTIGKRQTFAATLVGTREFANDWGVKTLVTFVDPDGNRIKSWASGDVSWLPEAGQTVTFKATVKDHGEYQGRKETTVQRLAAA
jgi:hypothetical protein